MPEYSRPNLSIPSTLWGEVKVAAFRQGVRPVEIVIECLRKRFGDDYLFSKESVKASPVDRKQVKEPKVGETPVHAGGLVAPVNAIVCVACQVPIEGAGYVYNKEKKPMCLPCAKKTAGVK